MLARPQWWPALHVITHHNSQKAALPRRTGRLRDRQASFLLRLTTMREVVIPTLACAIILIMAAALAIHFVLQ
jgi:hypothetical protein